MIYTVTMNPSLDYIAEVKSLTPGKTNRTIAESLLPGGKGLNVSMVLGTLGLKSRALGFTAGFTGMEIQRRMHEVGTDCDFIHLPEGMSRINIKLKSAEETEINAQGPDITEDSMQLLRQKLEEPGKGDILVLAGSVPKTAGDSFYAEIVQEMMRKEVLVVVDASGETLRNVLPFHPFLIKPNLQELSGLFGTEEITGDEMLKECAKELQKSGARNVLISLGKDGAAFLTENGTWYRETAFQGKVRNTVGSGDSMVAGFLYGYLSKKGTEEERYHAALLYGLAAGSAGALSEWLPEKEKIVQVYEEMIKMKKEKV